MGADRTRRLKKMRREAEREDRAYAQSTDGKNYQSRLDFATFILRELKEKGLTQKALADRIHMKPEQLNVIVHAEANFTMKTMWRIWDGLGMVGSPLNFLETSSASREPALEAQASTDGAELGGADGTRPSEGGENVISLGDYFPKAYEG